LNGTYQLLVYYADDINLLGNNINTTKEKRKKCREDKVYDHVSSSELRTEPEYKDT